MAIDFGIEDKAKTLEKLHPERQKIDEGFFSVDDVCLCVQIVSVIALHLSPLMFRCVEIQELQDLVGMQAAKDYFLEA